jgi:hypothetical protein
MKSHGSIPNSQSCLLVVSNMCTDPCSVAIARRGMPPVFASVTLENVKPRSRVNVTRCSLFEYEQA